MGMEIGGAETHVLELSIGLKKAGYDVAVVSNGGVYVKELEKYGIIHYNAPLHRRNVFAMVKSFFKLIRVISKEKPDIVHSHARIPSFIISIINKFMRFNFVTSAHWVFDTSGLLKFVTNWGKRTVAVSDDIKKYLIDNYGIVAQNIKVTVNGIDTEKFSKENLYPEIFEEFSLSESRRKILYISRMDYDRSLIAHKLIKIAPEILKKEDVQIIIVGGGNDFESIRNEAEEFNAKHGENSIIVTGARTDIYKFCAVSDFFVGVSRSALEAMSAGLPSIIAGNEGYIGIFDSESKDMCIDTNFCCRGTKMPEEKMLLSDTMKLLSLNKEDYESLSGYTKQFIKDNYSVERMVNDNIAVYENIIKKGNRYDIAVSGYYGFNNSGDDALLHLIIKEITEIKPDTRFVVFSNSPKNTQKVYGVDAVYRFNMFAVWRAIKKSNLLLTGGGSLLQDATSTKSLYYYLTLIKMAIKMGKKTMLYANGIGPIYIVKNKFKVKDVVEQIDKITLRDQVSYRMLWSMRVNTKNVKVTADPAITLKPLSDERIKEIFEQENIPQKEFVTISIREWSGIDLTEKVAEISDYIRDKYSLIPVFIPMQRPNDDEITQRTYSLLKGEGYILKGNYEFDEIMTIVSKSKIVIGMRLHTLLYGANSKIPVIGLVYDPKVDAYLEYLGQEYSINVDKMDMERFKDTVDDTMDKYDKIKSELAERVEELIELEKENAKTAVSLLEE